MGATVCVAEEEMAPEPSECFAPPKTASELGNEAHRTKVAKTLLKAAAANLRAIATLGNTPHPVVVSSRLKNVTPMGIWGAVNRWTLAHQPATWYFDEVSE